MVSVAIPMNAASSGWHYAVENRRKTQNGDMLADDHPRMDAAMNFRSD